MNVDQLLQAMAQAYRQSPQMVPSEAMRAILDVLHKAGYRRCAEGQRTTQWCDRANKAEAMIARLTGDLAGANRECEVRQERELGYLARAESAEAEVERLRAYIREREMLHAQSLDAAVAEVERLRGCRDELREIGKAIHDPRVHNTMTIAEWCYEAQAEVERLKADAERYRWLAWTSDTNTIMPYCLSLDRFYYGHEADVAIDAARGES